VQRKLTLLGFNTRGVDGLFGPGTRGAISGFQRDIGVEETGYLNREVMQVLNRRAARAEEDAARAEEAAAREAEASDRAFWDQTGARGDEDGLRAYLDRYPQGIFATRARDRLAEFERQSQGQERADWEATRDEDTASAYRGYLDRYPNGIFAAQAQERIAALTAPDPPAEEENAQARQDRAEEQQVAGNPVTRLLIERRLAQLGYDPGSAEGIFDQATRRAVRAFQEEEGLPVTGFISQGTVAALLGMGSD